MQTERRPEKFLENIVSITATEYVMMKGRNLAEYEAVGCVVVERYSKVDGHHYTGIPEGAESVVNTRVISRCNPYTNNEGTVYHGTALIIKNKQNE